MFEQSEGLIWQTETIYICIDLYIMIFRVFSYDCPAPVKFYSIWFYFTEKETFQLSRDKATGHNMGYVAVIKYNLHCKTRIITLYIYMC